MKIYSTSGLNDFIICVGYKNYLINEYFSNYFLHVSDVTLDLAKNTRGQGGVHRSAMKTV